MGATTREEAIATVREAASSGITVLDLAPRYGDGEAETVIGEAFRGHLPAGVKITTKHRVSNPSPADVAGRLERSLDESMKRLRLEFVDIYFLHGYLVPRTIDGGERRTPQSLFTEAVRPAFERLVEKGRIGAWGITAIGLPSTVLAVLADKPAPHVIQAVTNPLDSPGEMKWFDEPARPRDIIAAAHSDGIGVMGIRAVQAGALTDAIDRELPEDHPIRADFYRAAPLRHLADQLGESTASLAHRYALGMPDVDTVVIGVKNRAELRDCLTAENKGPLAPEMMQKLDAMLDADR
jgi:aryl-alcohol dehydrogenase-like predicted oxidoreductase